MIELAKLLAVAIDGIKAFRETRDRMVAAGAVDPADLPSDAELIELFRADAVAFRDRAGDLLRKWETPGTPAPVPGPVDPGR